MVSVMQITNIPFFVTPRRLLEYELYKSHTMLGSAKITITTVTLTIDPDRIAKNIHRGKQRHSQTLATTSRT